MLERQYMKLLSREKHVGETLFFSSLMAHFVKVRLYVRSTQSSAYLTLSQTSLESAF